jgi:hypothetical protein
MVVANNRCLRYHLRKCRVECDVGGSVSQQGRRSRAIMGAVIVNL